MNSGPFVESFIRTDQLLTEIINEKQVISLSLDQLSKLHHLQKMLEEFQFLNIVYSQASRFRKSLVTKTSSNLGKQQEICHAIDAQINLFLQFFKQLDDLILDSMNTSLGNDNCRAFLCRICKLILGSESFLVVFEINNKVIGLSSEACDIESVYQKLKPLKDSAKVILDEFGQKNLQLYKNKYSYMLYEECELPFRPFTDFRVIIDQFISLVYDFQKEIYDKSTVLNVLRGIKQLFIQHSTRICQEIIRFQIETVIGCKCWIEMPDQVQYLNEIIIDQHGNMITPVRFNKQIKFYIKIEQPCIDVITFSDFISQQWQQLTYRLKELKNEEFLHQMLEVTSPNKLIIQVTQSELRYQSCSVPAAWQFMEIGGTHLDQLKLEQVNKANLLVKMQELRQGNKNATSIGQIYYNDKSVNLDLYVKRDEEDIIQDYYLVFDPPKKKFEDSGRRSFQIGSENKLQELSQDAFVNLKTEKIAKACSTLRDYLRVDLQNDEIVELIKDKDLIKEVINKGAITDDVRSSYAMEYYNSDSLKNVRISTPDEPYKTQQLIAETQLTNIKKFELFCIDSDDISNLADYSFDITTVKDTNQQIRYTWALFHLCNFVDSYQINKETFYQFLVIVQEKYNCRSNPFHNYEHGFTVAHACYYLIKNKSLHQYFEKLIQFTALLSALCHDIDHTGRNNHFECQSLSKLALKYNDDSVLENHHASTMFRLLQKEKYNILSKLSVEQYKTFRKYAISNILATDMKKHFEIVKSLELKLSKLPDEPLIQNDEDKRFLSGAVIHTCDLYGQTKEFSIAHKWSLRIQREFHAQLEEEQSLALPVTPHFLRNDAPNFNQTLAKQEISFIKFIVKPAWDLTAQALQRGLEIPLKNLEENLKEWEREAR